MYYSSSQRTMGTVFMIAGGVLFLFAAYTFLWRIMTIFFAFQLINHGLRLRGLPSLQFMARTWFNMFRI